MSGRTPDVAASIRQRLLDASRRTGADHQLLLTRYALERLLVEPRPKLVEYPIVLDHAPPRIKAYPREAVVAEKLEAMVQLGMVNSRMKDVHDLWTLAREHAFDGAVLARSITATFTRRGTPIPKVTPVALTHEFADDPSRVSMWRAFLGRVGLVEPALLRQAVEDVEVFAGPILDALAKDTPWSKRWLPGGPWRSARQ